MDSNRVPAPLPGMVTNAVQQSATVVEQERLAHDTYRIRLECPEIARRITPGQFFMVRSPDSSDPLLGRPFALYDIYEDSHGQPAGVDFGYVVVGKLTSRMTQWQTGDVADVWGPLGNGFPSPPTGHLMMIAGGIGVTPFLAVSREALGQHAYGLPARVNADLPSRLTLCYGVRSQDYLAGVDQFRGLDGLEVQIATDDGSVGQHGFVTELLQTSLKGDARPDAVYCCGPEPMMHAVAKIADQAGVPCWLSLETPMACGFGACFSCVTRVRLDDGNWDYRRTCVEGPVFPAHTLMLS